MRFLRKKGEDYLYAWTQHLADRPDMEEVTEGKSEKQAVVEEESLESEESPEPVLDLTIKRGRGRPRKV